MGDFTVEQTNNMDFRNSVGSITIREHLIYPYLQICWNDCHNCCGLIIKCTAYVAADITTHL